jgi:protoheme IX farnesyltransferase
MSTAIGELNTVIGDGPACGVSAPELMARDTVDRFAGHADLHVATANHRGRSRPTALAHVADYLELTKPKIAVLELVCVAVAAMVAGPVSLVTLAATLLGTALIAASASAFNQWLERHSDRLMERTADRPLPQGRLTAAEVALFGAVTLAGGTAVLLALVNLPTAVVCLGTWVMYVAVYTPLKRRSVSNTMVGAIAGALPVLMGWTCAGRALDLEASALFLIVFLWQFPHFMAIAWIYRRQYAAADLKMLPVVEPTGRRAGAQAVIAALAIIPVSVVPAWHLIEPVYFGGAVLLGAGQLFCAAAFLCNRNDNTARRLLRASLVYLPGLLMLLLMSPLI